MIKLSLRAIRQLAEREAISRLLRRPDVADVKIGIPTLRRKKSGLLAMTQNFIASWRIEFEIFHLFSKFAFFRDAPIINDFVSDNHAIAQTNNSAGMGRRVLFVSD